MRVIVVFIIFCLMNNSCFAAGNTELKMAASLYDKGMYDSAARLYEQLALSYPDHPAIWYNLGTASYKSGNVGKAVWGFKKALSLNPSDAHAKENLGLAEIKINSPIQPSRPIFFIRWWQSITHASMNTIWSLLALFSFIALLAIWSYKILRKPQLPFQLIAGTALFLLITLGLAILSGNDWHGNGEAVVLVPELPIYNDASFSKMITYVPEGTVVRLTNEQAAKYEVQLPDGRTGWVATTGIVKI